MKAGQSYARQSGLSLSAAAETGTIPQEGFGWQASGLGARVSDLDE